MALQNQKNSKSSKNTASLKAKDAQNHENDEQEESNCEQDKGQGNEPNANAVDEKKTMAEGAQASKGKPSLSKGQKEDKKDKNQSGGGNDPHYLSHEALSNFYGMNIHPMQLQFY